MLVALLFDELVSRFGCWLHSLCAMFFRQGILVGFVVVAIVVFLATNITCASLVNSYRSHSESPPKSISIARVSINDSLFLLLGAMLSVFIYRVSRIATVSVVLEAKVC